MISEIVTRDRLLDRAPEIAGRIAKLPPLPASYTRIALTHKLRRVVDETVGNGLALEGLSAADVALASSLRETQCASRRRRRAVSLIARMRDVGRPGEDVADADKRRAREAARIDASPRLMAFLQTPPAEPAKQL